MQQLGEEINHLLPGCFYICRKGRCSKLMKELKVRVGLNQENKVTYIEPRNQATGKTVEHVDMLCRLVTAEEEQREYAEMMEDGCRTYKRVRGRIREVR